MDTIKVRVSLPLQKKKMLVVHLMILAFFFFSLTSLWAVRVYCIAVKKVLHCCVILVAHPYF